MLEHVSDALTVENFLAVQIVREDTFCSATSFKLEDFLENDGVTCIDGFSEEGGSGVVRSKRIISGETVLHELPDEVSFALTS